MKSFENWLADSSIAENRHRDKGPVLLANRAALSQHYDRFAELEAENERLKEHPWSVPCTCERCTGIKQESYYADLDVLCSICGKAVATCEHIPGYEERKS